MRKILIIEDEEVLASMYKEKFEREGFQVLKVSLSEEGIKLINEQKPDIILLDILLPKGNGIFFLKAKHRNPAVASIPVVVFSNYDDPKTRKEALELGALDYLMKTKYTPQAIVEKIKGYLGSQG